MVVLLQQVGRRLNLTFIVASAYAVVEIHCLTTRRSDVLEYQFRGRYRKCAVT